VEFASDFLFFILYAMLPKDKKIHSISGEKIHKYQDKALELMKKISDTSSLKQAGKNSLLSSQPQSFMIMFIFSEMLEAYEDEEIGDKFRQVFICQALTLIRWLDGEIE
jgi:hypothetical protein